MKRIRSSNLAGAQLDGATILIQFRRTGACYRYDCGDPIKARWTYERLLTSDSAGRYFAAVIRHLPYERIKDLY